MTARCPVCGDRCENVVPFELPQPLPPVPSDAEAARRRVNREAAREHARKKAAQRHSDELRRVERSPEW